MCVSGYIWVFEAIVRPTHVIRLLLLCGFRTGFVLGPYSVTSPFVLPFSGLSRGVVLYWCCIGAVLVLSMYFMCPGGYTVHYGRR